MRRTVLGSMTKFWPRCLVGRRSSRSASRRTSAGPSRLGPAEGVVTGTSVEAVSDRPRSAARRRSRPRPQRTRSAIAICCSRLFWWGMPGAAVRRPGAEAELQPAVVAVAGVGGPVATGLARGDGVPDAAAADRGRRGGGSGGLDLGADRDDRVDRLAHGARADHDGAHGLAVAEAGAVGDVADAVTALADRLGLALGHRVVVAPDGAGLDRLVGDALLHDAALDHDHAVAVLQLGAARGTRRRRRGRPSRRSPEQLADGGDGQVCDAWPCWRRTSARPSWAW